jgi:DNA-directed RNA polymerase subunit RPC12/RpoP
MHNCAGCGGQLRRVHRTFFQRIGYMAIYQCKSCQEEQVMPRRWRYHLGPAVHCPQCGTERVTKLKSPDRIDPMQAGFLNFLERLLDGKLYHCRYCRIQFYDRRGFAPVREHPTERGAEEETAESRGHTA